MVNSKSRGLYALALALLVFAVFARAGGNEFVDFDTAQYLTRNVEVRRGLSWSGFVWAWTSGHATNWHPLTWLSHMVDADLFGLAPRGHHLVNAAFHALNTALVYWLFVELTGQWKQSLFVAALFGLHPMHVESVAWIVERKDVLSAAFGLSALIAYQRYARTRPRGAYVLALVLFALGLTAKPMLVTLPCVMLLLDFWPLERMKEGARALVIEKLPFFALSAASSLVTYLVQDAGGATTTLERLSLSTRIANAVTSYVGYLWKLVWPVDLCVYYPHARAAQPLSQVLLAGLFLALVSTSAFLARRARPYLWMGWLFFLGTLVPVIGLVQVGGQSMADRYSYLPYLGVFVAITWAVGDLVAARPRLVPWCAASAVVVIAALGALSWRQIGVWKNTATLCEHALAVTSDNYVVHNMLGFDLAEKGEMDEASAHFREALRIFPRYVNARYNLGIALERERRLDEAIEQYEAALAISPDDAHVNARMVSIFEQRGDLSRALPHLEAVIRATPENPTLHVSLGQYYLRLARPADADAAFARALSLARESGEKGTYAEVERRIAAARGATPGAGAPR